MPAAYKIPQNVDLEDKILGPFTLKQFLYILAAGFVVFVTFRMLWTPAPWLFFIITFFNVVITGALVFVRPNDQPFSKFVGAFIGFTTKPQRRSWKRVPTLGEVTFSDTPAEQAPPVVAEPSPEEVRSRLQRLAHIVDTRGWSAVDTDEADIIDRVTSEGEAKPKLNIFMATTEEPEDILAREDESPGHSDRASSELDRALHEQTAKQPTGGNR